MASPLLQLLDALDRCVEPEHHTRLIAEALERAGLDDLPVDRDAFRRFVSDALAQTTKASLGEAVATELTWTLMRMTSVRAPKSGRPSPERYQTVEYNEDAFAPRPDVMLVGPPSALVDELTIHLEARGYRVQACEEPLASVTRDSPPRMVITHVDETAGLRCAAKLRDAFGAKAPPVVVLTEATDPAAPPAGVARMLARASLAPIDSAVEERVGAREA